MSTGRAAADGGGPGSKKTLSQRRGVILGGWRRGNLAPKYGKGWFERLRWLFRFGQQVVREAEVPSPESNPAPTISSAGTQYNADAAVSEFGENFIGIVEIGTQGPRVTAGTYAKNANHLTLSKQNLGPLQSGQRRFGFVRNRGGIIIGPSSTGAIPTIAEVGVIRAALGQQGYLTLEGLHLIISEDDNGEQHVYNLRTEEMIQ